MTVGAATGLAVAYSLHTDVTTTMLFMGLGSITGLIPDLDINGKLSNKITFSHKFIQNIVRMMSFLIPIYSYVELSGIGRWLGIGIGVSLYFLTTFITQRLMLTLTGAGVLTTGFYFSENWTILLAIYMIIASVIPHRSYTHSLLGVLFFGVIAFLFEVRMGIHGVFLTCILGYISHLIADMKIFSCNKRGVKLFLPFSKKEF